MIQYTLMEKLEMMLNIIKVSPFFIICFLTGISFIIYTILDIVTRKKINEKLLFITIIAILTFITCFYYEYIMFLSDNFVLKLLEAIYFPNFAIYFLILAIINTTFFITILREKTPLSIKITNFTSTLIIDFIFILVLGIIISDKVDIYDTLTAIANPNLLICLELTTITFVAWYMINNFVKLIERTFKIEVKEIKQEVPAQIKIEKIGPVKPVLAPIPKPVHNFEILYEKFQNGEELNVEQYQILKNYLIENQ